MKRDRKRVWQEQSFYHGLKSLETAFRRSREEIIQIPRAIVLHRMAQSRLQRLPFFSCSIQFDKSIVYALDGNHVGTINYAKQGI